MAPGKRAYPLSPAVSTLSSCAAHLKAARRGRGAPCPRKALKREISCVYLVLLHLVPPSPVGDSNGHREPLLRKLVDCAVLRSCRASLGFSGVLRGGRRSARIADAGGDSREHLSSSCLSLLPLPAKHSRSVFARCGAFAPPPVSWRSLTMVRCFRWAVSAVVAVLGAAYVAQGAAGGLLHPGTPVKPTWPDNEAPRRGGMHSRGTRWQHSPGAMDALLHPTSRLTPAKLTKKVPPVKRPVIYYFFELDFVHPPGGIISAEFDAVLKSLTNRWFKRHGVEVKTMFLEHVKVTSSVAPRRSGKQRSDSSATGVQCSLKDRAVFLAPPPLFRSLTYALLFLHVPSLFRSVSRSVSLFLSQSSTISRWPMRIHTLRWTSPSTVASGKSQESYQGSSLTYVHPVRGVGCWVVGGVG